MSDDESEPNILGRRAGLTERLHPRIYKYPYPDPTFDRFFQRLQGSCREFYPTLDRIQQYLSLFEIRVFPRIVTITLTPNVNLIPDPLNEVGDRNLYLLAWGSDVAQLLTIMNYAATSLDQFNISVRLSFPEAKEHRCVFLIAPWT